jgi:hypothetical protein
MLSVQLGRAMIADMVAVFSTIHSDETIASTPEIQASIEAFRVRRQTGLMRLSYSPSDNLYLFFNRGKAISSIVTDSGETQPHFHDQWQEKIQTAGDAYAKTILLSPLGLLLTGISLQMQDAQPEEIASAGDVAAFFKSKNRLVGSSLFQFNWHSSAGLVFFPDDREPPYSVYVSKETVLDEVGVSRVFHDWEDTGCKASVYFPDSSVDLWQEYRLRRLFAYICKPMLERFEILTGRVLMDSLVRLMMIFSSEHDLDISISSRSLINREVFFSSELAAHKYQLYLNEIFQHCSAVIGPRLLASVLREILSELPEVDRGLLKTYSLVPRGIIV